MKIFAEVEAQNPETGELSLAYKWMDVDIHNKQCFRDDLLYTKDGKRIPYSQVIKVKCDIRKKYKKCVACGKLVLNTPEALEQHFKDRESNFDCKNCPKMRYESTGKSETKVKHLNGNQIIRTTKEVFEMSCGGRNIASVIECRNCDNFRCRRYGYFTLDDITVQFPKWKQTFITIASLSKVKGWHFYEKRSDLLYTYTYQYKKTNLFARFNSLGVLEGFVYHNRSRTMTFVYSKDYDRYFQISGRYVYTMVESNLSTSENTQNAVKNAIKGLC